MNINLRKILKYAEARLYSERVSDRAVYNHLAKTCNELLSDFNADEYAYINQIYTETGMEKRLVIANLQSVIERLNREINFGNTIFETKEEHSKFIKAWKVIHKNLRPVEIVGGYSTVKVDGKWVSLPQMKSSLTLAHHLVYLAATGKLNKAIHSINPCTLNIITRYGFFDTAIADFSSIITVDQKHVILGKLYEWEAKKRRP